VRLRLRSGRRRTREPPGIIRSGNWLCHAAEPFVAAAPPENAERLRAHPPTTT
jgi:hypothetical protein